MARWFACQADATQELSAKRLHAWLQNRSGPLRACTGPPGLLEPGTIYLVLHSGKPLTPLDLHPHLRENWLVKNKSRFKRGRLETDAQASEWLFAAKKPSLHLGLRALICTADEVPNETRVATRMVADEFLYLFCAYSKRQSSPGPIVDQHATTERMETPMAQTFTLMEEFNSQDTQQLLRSLRQHVDAVNAISVILTRRLNPVTMHAPIDVRQPPEDEQLFSLPDDLPFILS